MYGISKQGFTILESLIVIFLIGLLTTLVIINLRSLNPASERREFVATLNSLVQFAWQNALSSNKINRIIFEVDNELIRIEQQKNNQGEKYEQVPTDYIATTITIPTNLEIRQFFINSSEDELTRLREAKERSIWFFIMPDGITQEVTINFVDHSELNQQNEPVPFSIVLNPFAAQFKLYDTFQSP